MKPYISVSGRYIMTSKFATPFFIIGERYEIYDLEGSIGFKRAPKNSFHGTLATPIPNDPRRLRFASKRAADHFDKGRYFFKKRKGHYLIFDKN